MINKLEEEQALQLRITNLITLLNEGIINLDQLAEELGYDAPTASQGAEDTERSGLSATSYNFDSAFQDGKY
ncbi:MAG: hypothetical protein OXB93_04370 [Cytophagales bacterium]|nr:hypothetical protein [Cytophagales bacterium]